MVSEIFLPTIYFIVATVELIFAVYLILSDTKSLANRYVGALLSIYALNSISVAFTLNANTLNQAAPYHLLQIITTYIIGPLVYLTSVAVLRQKWFRHRWLYWPVFGFMLLIIFAPLLDAWGISQALFNSPLIFLANDLPNYTKGYMITRDISGGYFGDFFGISIQFLATIAFICPQLVVAIRDRKSNPTNSRAAWLLSAATIAAIVFQVFLTQIFPAEIIALPSNLTYVTLLLIAAIQGLDAPFSLSRLQKSLGNWPVFSKLVLIILTIVSSLAFITIISTRSVLRSSISNQVGESLVSLATTQAGTIRDTLSNIISAIDAQVSQSPVINFALRTRNSEYDDLSENEIATLTEARQSAMMEAEFESEVPFFSSTSRLEVDSFRNDNPNFERILVLDKRGMIFSADTLQNRYDFSNEAWWEQVYNDGNGGFYIGLPKFFAETGDYLVTVVTPVYASNEFQGVVASELNLQGIASILEQSSLGETGRTALFTPDGEWIKVKTSEAGSFPIRDWDVLIENETSWDITLFEGVDSIISFIKIDSGEISPNNPLSNLNWYIVFHQALDEGLAPINLANRITLFSAIGSLLFALVLTWILARFITQPLSSLSNAATKVTEGDLDVVAEVTGEDEFGTLAKSFNTMTSRIRGLISGLEGQVAARTAALEKRAIQMQAAAEVGQVAVSIRDIDEMLSQISNLISQRFGFYHTGVFLVSEDGKFAELKAANSEGGQRMLARQHRLKVGGVGIVGYVTEALEPRIALDVGQDAVFFDNPDLPETRSEMAVPLISGGKIIGALDVQSKQEAAFSEEDVEILRILADQIAVAIDNARLFSENQAAIAETQNALEAARRAYGEGSRKAWGELLQNRSSLGYRAGVKGVSKTEGGVWPKEMARARAQTKPFQEENGTLALPLQIRDNVAGALRFKKPETEGEWTNDEISLLQKLTQNLSNALENARLYEDTQVSLDRTEALFEVSRSAISSGDITELMTSVVDRIATTLPAHKVLLITLDFNAQKTTHFIENGTPIGKVTPISYENLMDGLTGWVIRERKIAISPKKVRDPRESMEVYEGRIRANVGSVIVVPMLFGSEFIGTITASNTLDMDDFTQADGELMLTMANQVATAIRNSELDAQTRRRALQLETAAEVSQVASSILELDQLLPEVSELIRDRFDFYYVGVFIADSRDEWADLRAGTGEPGIQQLDRGHRLRIGGSSMIGQCILTAEPKIALDVGEEAFRFQNPFLPDTRSEMALPLTALGRTFGALTIQSTESAAFSPEDIAALQTMIDQLAIAIQNANLFRQTQTQNANLAVLNEMSRELSNLQNIDAVIENIYVFASQLIDTSNFLISLYNAEDNTVTYPLVVDEKIRIPPPKGPQPIGKGFSSKIFKSKKPFLISENSLEKMRDLGIELVTLTEQDIPGSWLGVPFTFGNQIIGIIAVQSLEKGFYTERDQDLLVAIASQAAIAIQNAQLFSQVQSSLSETERLYRASADLNTAQSYADIISVMQRYTVFGNIEDANVNLAYFDVPWSENVHPNEILILERYSPSPIPDGLPNRYPLSQFEFIIENMTRDEPLIIQDVKKEDVDGATRELAERLNFGSLAFLPLVSGGQWRGYLGGFFRERTTISENDKRLLMAIAAQAAVAVHGLFQLDQIRGRAQREQVLSEITARVHRSTDPNTIMQTAIREVGRALRRKAFIYLGDQDAPSGIDTEPEEK